MNRENIKKVRDVIAELDRKRFNMAFVSEEIGGRPVSPKELVHNCNTAGCIAGWSEAVLSEREGQSAEEILGLRFPLSSDLFMPDGYDSPGRYTQAHAVRVLDHLLETGEVDWVSTRRAKKAVAS